MARPPTEIRTAVLDAIRTSPCTLVDIVQRANVSYAAARYTLQNAMRGGAVQICGQEKRAHSKNWLAIYELAPDVEPAPETFVPGADGDGGLQVHFEQLGCALRAWSSSLQHETKECECE